MAKNIKKAVITNRIMLTRTPELVQKLIKELTYKFRAGNGLNSRMETHCDLKLLTDDIVSIPVGRQDLIPKNYVVIDKRVTVPVQFPEFRATLRPSQQEIYDDIDDNAIINAKPGFGKTFTALAIASKLGQKTLIIVHKITLRDQWVKEIKKVFGIDAGVIGSGRMELDSPIVVANIQTLNKVVDPKLIYTFGTVVVDECLEYNTLVDTLEYGPKKIGVIVNQKLPVHVKSFNNGKIEYNKVLRFFKNKETFMLKLLFDSGSALNCTENHTIYVYNVKKDTIEKIQAGYLNIGDYVISAPLHKTAHLLDTENIDILLGCILGDGSLTKTASNVRVRITQGEAQKEYLEYKKRLLNNICSDAKTVESRSGYKPENKVYAISTKTFVDTFNWRTELYGNSTSKVSVSKNISDLLSLEAWSLIYMDDGSISQGYISFHVYLDTQGLHNLISSLKRIFKVNAYTFTYTRNNKQLTGIKLSREDSKTFIRMIEHLIHPCLSYKKGEYGTGKQFTGITRYPKFKKYTVQKLTDIQPHSPTGGFRYNIEVENTHNYFANGKLVSNCHHLPSTTFKKTVDKLKARYKIGLSATLRRSDGKGILLQEYIGDKIYTPPKENTVDPLVLIRDTGITLPGNARTPWATRMNKLYENNKYVEEVIRMAISMAEYGHIVLVLASRVEFCETCAELTPGGVAITASTKNREEIENRVLSGETPILYATSSIYSEGVSRNEFSCCIMAMAFKDESLLEQIAGRVNRKNEGGCDPVLVDMALRGTTGVNQLKERKKVYAREGWKVEHI